MNASGADTTAHDIAAPATRRAAPRLAPLSRIGTAVVVLALLTTLGGTDGGALAADVRVLCPSALRTPVLELARAYAREQHHRVEFIFASVGAIHKRVATGERADMAIGTAQGVDALVRLGRGIDHSQAPLVRSAVAIVVRKGAEVPDLDNVDALVQSLRRAASVALPDPGLGVPGGAQVVELLERLGILDELKPRVRFVADAREVAKGVAAGSIEIGLAAMGDVVTATNVTVVGPLLTPATTGVAYAAVVVRGATSAEHALAFIAHLRSRSAATVFRKAGYVPID